MDKNNFGNKAANLFWLKKETGKVPEFFIIEIGDIVENFFEIQENIGKIMGADSRDISIVAAAIGKVIDLAVFKTAALQKAISGLKGFSGKEFILRTSSAQEDLNDFSFAGLYESVGPFRQGDFIHLQEFLKRCWRSVYSERVLGYLLVNGLSAGVQEFSVIAQVFYSGLFSGVAFSNPSSKHCDLVYSVGAQAAVDGGDAEKFGWDFGFKELPLLMKKNGIRRKNWEKFISYLEEISVKKGIPQDLEWSLRANDFAIIQTRDITASLPGRETIWDSTNIAESYPGVTLPLTFSFIRHAYSQVYLAFLVAIGVKKEKIERSRDVFANLLGHLHGHVYYNAVNWYELVKLLPGYRFNKDFFEAMWNPVKKNSSVKPKNSLALILKSLPLFFKFIFKLLVADRDISIFVSDFEKKMFLIMKENIVSLETEILAEQYLKVEKSFFSSWSTPILNDFRVMIFHGILRKLISFKSSQENDCLTGSLLMQHAGLDSLRPIKKLLKVVLFLKSEQKLVNFFKQEKSGFELWVELGQKDEIEFRSILAKIQGFIFEFGNRNPSELKLESPTMKENPGLAIDLLRSYLKAETCDFNGRLSREVPSLKKLIIGRFGFGGYCLWPFSEMVLFTAKKAVSAREQMRLLRSRAFGYARKIFMELGQRLELAGILESKEDVFYLNREEILNWAKTRQDELSLKSLVKKRMEIFLEYKNEKAPPRRVKTYGDPATSLLFPDGHSDQDNSRIRGIPASEGVVRGEVLCLKYYDSGKDFSGKILVALQTDPGWTTIFPLIKGLVTERGNILSHAAIISRELGIPSVVAVRGATDIFKDGDIIEINGSSGEVKKIN